jgi:hypothetical protein
MRRRTLALALAMVLIGTTVACGGESAAEACARGPLFSSARIRMERAVTELDRTTALELEESLTAIVDQVLVLREVSPRELRDPLGVLLAAYGQLVVALNQVAWDPQAALADAQVATARSAFAETSVSSAADIVEDFFARQCELAIGQSNPLFAVTGTTLPLPEPGEEARLDADEDSAVPASELQAIGFVIGEAYGVALLPDQAECIATRLGLTFAEASDIDVSQEQFFDLINETFVSCGVTTPPTTTPDN